MKTIRGKIRLFFVLWLVIVGLLIALNYENTSSLKRKLVIMEAFEDILEDTLELRRYEKNFIYYRNTASLDECVFYLFKLEDSCKRLQKYVAQVVGPDECRKFQLDLAQYKEILQTNIGLAKGGATNNLRIKRIRAKGKDLVNFAEHLIMVKRGRIEKRLRRSLAIPLISMGGFVFLIIFIFHLVNRGILIPLSLVEKAKIGRASCRERV